MNYAKIKIGLPKRLAVLKLKDNSFAFYTDLDLDLVENTKLNRKTGILTVFVDDREIKIRIINKEILSSKKEIYLFHDTNIENLDKAKILKVEIN